MTRSKLAIRAVSATAVLAAVVGSAAMAVAETNPSPDDVAAQLTATAEQTLAKSADVGAGEITVLGDNFKELPLEDLDEASSIAVDFSEGDNSWKIFLGPSDSAGMTLTPSCPENVVGLVECAATPGKDGSTVLETVVLLQRIPGSTDADPRYLLVDEATAAKSDPADLQMSHNLRTFWVDGSVTSVTEDVNSPDTLDPQGAFESPTSDLRQLSQNEELAAP